VKLVTFADPDGRMRCGALDNSHVRTIDGVATMLELFESGEDVGTVGAGANGERLPLADVRLQAPDHPEEVLPHLGQLPRARGRVEDRQLVARDRALDRVLPEHRRDHRARGADRLPLAPDQRARLRSSSWRW